ncbi:collagen triple helix repeat-containing protein 1-like [Corticium candelabrum]|uniref:collagen triple helix repeat-containing protein 1-like n=1 Tax=Corticium candelabrum TaxID=121492 RepID=UPI002E27338A|nr:collagen triple helix repeat-containing protein 1-like [Corticium candelabrum]
MTISVSYILLVPSLIFFLSVVTSITPDVEDGVGGRLSWKQCTWTVRHAKDSGKICECKFRVEHPNSSLHVVYSGVNRVYCNGYHQCCSRWYLKFNDTECNNPGPIDLVVFKRYTDDSPYRTRQAEGYCNNMTRGEVTVELHVGKCLGWHKRHDYDYDNANTGWFEDSPSRILIREVYPYQK